MTKIDKTSQRLNPHCCRVDGVLKRNFLVALTNDAFLLPIYQKKIYPMESTNPTLKFTIIGPVKDSMHQNCKIGFVDSIGIIR